MPRLREPQKKDEEEKPEYATASSDNSSEVTITPDEGVLSDESIKAEQDRNADELKRQIEALRKSEAAARQQAQQAAAERDQAMRYAQERNAALFKSERDVIGSRLDSVNNGLAAADAEIEEAKNAFRMASIEQDIDAQVAAQERLAEAKANKVNLTNGKAALERAINEQKERAQQQQAQPQQQGDQLDRTNLPQTAKNWLRAHPEYMTDPRKNSKIQSLHWDVLDEGHEPFSSSYYESLEVHLGLRAKPQQEVEDEVEEVQPVRKSVVSAPVSREAPSSSGVRSATSVRLTAAQREAAKLAGITEAEYAKQLVNLNNAKANGSYGGQP